MFRVVINSILFLIFISQSSYAQESTIDFKKNDKIEITMSNGDVFIGQFMEENDSYLTIEVEDEELALIKSNVISIKKSDIGLHNKISNRNMTRYFFAPSAIPLKRRHGYYQNVMLSSNYANVGVTNNISMGGGFETISLALGAPIWFLTPKVGVQVSDNFYVGGGLYVAGIKNFIAGIGYGVVTYGNPDYNVTVGAGYGLFYFDQELAKSESPVFMVAGTAKLNRTIALLSENYFIRNKYTGLLGVRILSNKSSFDVGFVFSKDLGDLYFPALPYVGYVRLFDF